MSPFVLFAALAFTAGAAEGDLVTRLGAASPTVSKAAEQALWRMGREALPQLKKGVASDDREVSFRCRELMRKIHLGLRPEWSRLVVYNCLDYHATPAKTQAKTLQSLKEFPLVQTVTFLFYAVGKDSSVNAKAIVSQISASKDRRVAEQLLQMREHRYSKEQLTLLKWARELSGNGRGYMKAILAVDALAPKLQQELLGLQFQLIRENAIDTVEDTLRRIAATGKKDVTWFVLDAIVTVQAVGEDDIDVAVIERIFNAEKDVAQLYTVATKLAKEQYTGLAKFAYERIISVDVDTGVYSLNAQFSLSSYYEARGEWAMAAKFMETGCANFLEARKGGGMGIIGADADTIAKHVEHLKQQAAKATADQAPARGGLTYTIDPRLQVRELIKGGEDNEKNYLAMLKRDDLIFNSDLNVQPRGIRLIEMNIVTVLVNLERRQVEVRLNKSLVIAMPFDTKRTSYTFILNEDDMSFLYMYDGDKDETRQLQAYEKDYVLTPIGKDHEEKFPVLYFDDRKVTAEELKDGVKVDRLPSKITTEPPKKKD